MKLPDEDLNNQLDTMVYYISDNTTYIPAEIISVIIGFFDIKTVCNFRLTSNKSKQFVENFFKRIFGEGQKNLKFLKNESLARGVVNRGEFLRDIGNVYAVMLNAAMKNKKYLNRVFDEWNKKNKLFHEYLRKEKIDYSRFSSANCNFLISANLMKPDSVGKSFERFKIWNWWKDNKFDPENPLRLVMRIIVLNEINEIMYVVFWILKEFSSSSAESLDEFVKLLIRRYILDTALHKKFI
jgi:hypothetical protein